jgi:hypothetical protein
MSVPSQFGPPPKKPLSNGGRTLLFVALGVAAVSLVCCGGICAGGLLLITTRSTTLAELKTAVQDQMPAPLVAPRWEEDWMTMEQLTRAYTTSLDAVTADERVIARLGEPMEAVVGKDDKLFRRERTGRMDAGNEDIHFDIQGPKGAAAVHAVCSSAQGLPGSFAWSRATKITVKFKDDSEIDVPPPVEKNPLEP